MNFFQYITLAVSLGSAFGVGFAFFIKSKRSSSGEALSLLQKENEIFRDQLHKKEEAHALEVKEIRADFTKQVSELTEKFGYMQGKYEKEKEEKDKWEAIAKDKNPETKEFMTFMVQAVKDQAESHRKIVEVLNDIHTMTKDEHDRDLQITSTVTKQ